MPATTTHSEATELWQQVFGNRNPVEIEIGPGTGIFVLSASRARPDTNFFAIEKSASRARLLDHTVKAQARDNVVVLLNDATFVLEAMVPRRSIQAYHIYFPDPWWKRRHQRRRIFTPAFVAALARSLVPGGWVYIATDVDMVFDLMQASLRACSDFVEDPTKPSPRVTITTFERKGLARGATIRQSAFQRR